MRRFQTKSRSSFTSRRLAKKSTRNIIVSILLVLLFMYMLLSWILPALIGSLSFLNKFKKSELPTTKLSETPTLAPPVLTIPYEATNTANIDIKGYAQAGSKVEIYVDEELKETVDTQEDGSFIAKNIELALGINNITGKAMDEQNNKSLSSKNIRLIYDNKKPKLEISSPSDGQIISGGDKKVLIKGQTDPGNSITANTVRAVVDNDGNFSTQLEINEGENTLTITSIDLAGNKSEKQLKVTYQNQ